MDPSGLLAERSSPLALNRGLELGARDLGDADGDDALALGQAGLVRNLVLGRNVGAVISSMIAVRIKLLQQLAAPSDRPCLYPIGELAQRVVVGLTG